MPKVYIVASVNTPIRTAMLHLYGALAKKGAQADWPAAAPAGRRVLSQDVDTFERPVG
jgi:hypothetical protein